MKEVSNQILGEIEGVRRQVKLKESELEEVKSQYAKVVEEKDGQIEQLRKQLKEEMLSFKQRLMNSNRSERSLMDKIKEKDSLIASLMSQISSMSANSNLGPPIKIFTSIPKFKCAKSTLSSPPSS